MKNDENQTLSKRYFAMGLGIFAILGFFSIPTWTRQRKEEMEVSAKRQAEVLGYQVFEIYSDAARNASVLDLVGSRSPASLKAIDGDISNLRESGSIGSDPWGQPYRYKILSAALDQLRVQIWSAGPNKTFETSDRPGIPADSYDGDDVGLVLSLNQKPVE
ncbi:MAG: hypothetical protein IPM97_04390 [Bdellovibrionaceae bacterium]|nr:hypothetical protein [Pseudobdellovibrionaceae bacterium]